MDLYSLNISFEAILRNCILKIFPSRQLFGAVLYKSLFEAILRNCILKIFTVRQLSGVVSPHFVLEQLYGAVFPQNISFEAILRNCILKTFLFEATLRSCIPILPFEAILLNCILKTFPLRQLCGVVFSKHFL